MSSMNVMNVMNVLQGHQGGKSNFYPCVCLGNVHDVHNVHEGVLGVFRGLRARFGVGCCCKSVRGGGGITE